MVIFCRALWPAVVGVQKPVVERRAVNDRSDSLIPLRTNRRSVDVP
jgi:hypothetical protein